MKTFIVDLDICNGCYCCQIACKDEHVANDWTPYAKPQPDYGQFWLKLKEEVRGTVPKVKVTYTPNICMHCSDDKCISVCKPNAIYRREDGMVVIDPVKCTGCKACVAVCPGENIYFNEGLNIAQKCTGCAHLLDDGWDMPRCADACPTQAIRFGEESEFKDLIAKAEPHSNGCVGRVFYLNLPKKFVAGTVYDPVEKEVVIGATCTLTDKESKESFKVETDDYGDFWFRGLADGRTFSLKIEKGAKSKNLDKISTVTDMNLGDIAMAL